MSKPSSTSPLAVKDVVHKIQLCLLEGVKSETHLLIAGSVLAKSDYHDVVTERSIANMCGYPLCPNSLPSPSEPQKKGRYRISLKEHKVYDLVETRMYCSTKCVVDSRAYAESLQDQRSLALDTAKLDKVVRVLGLSLNAEEGLGKNSDFGMGNLSIKEKEDGSGGGGIVSMEEWIGPSNAIEGYVPQYDRSSKNKAGSKLKDSKLKREEGSIFDEMNFMSTIITQDNGYSISKEPSGKTKKFPSAIPTNSKKKMNYKGTNDGLTVSADSSCNARNMHPTSEIVTNHMPNIHDVPSSPCQSGVDANVMKSDKIPTCCKEAQPSSSGIKSSLKSSGASRSNRSISWADEKTDGAHNQTLSEFSGMENEKDTCKGFGITDKSNDDDDHAFRLASAEASAVALSQAAAAAVASGESDVPKAGSTLKDSKLKSEEGSLFDDLNFMSTVITQDNGYSISNEPFGQTKKIPSVISKDSRKKMNHKGTNDGSTVSADSSHYAENVPQTKLNELNNEESEIVTNHKPRILDVSSGACPKGVDVNVIQRVGEAICDKETQPSCSGLKSSMKSLGVSRTNHSVTWADEKTDGAHNQTLSVFSGMENEKDTSKGCGIIDKSIDEGDHALRFASAEACAVALSQAAEAVASGESDVPDAVSEAGLLILPPPLDENEVISEEIVGVIDPEPARLKWPKRTGIVESDFFDSEDSWFDGPPEEFVVDLSPFATMFMSLFAWISSSTLAYVYGCDDSVHEEYASINGREYPRKIVLTDGRSSEIKQTLAGCLSRALPGLVHDLRLRTPVSTIEYGMGGLLATMSFLDPLPSLRMKQWQVLVLLFVDALSVCRIPAISPHLTNRRSFFQKVLDGAGISTEEYEVLKDLILPLGRVPRFATQRQSGA